EQPRAVLLLKDDHVGVRGAVEPQPRHEHFDHRHLRKTSGVRAGVPRGARRVPARGPQRVAPAAAARRASTRSVRSQENSVFSPDPLRTVCGARPKCPYAAVAPKIGLRRSSDSVMPRGVRLNVSLIASQMRASGTEPVPNVSTITETGSATPIA